MASDIHETAHSGHCRRCKVHVRRMLTSLFGECEVNCRFPWSAKPEEYAPTRIGETLKAIRTALGDFRGHRNFIRTPLMPPCDYYLPKQKLIVEFDESQHFTRQRSITLSLYPADLTVGFPLERWRGLCDRIKATDDTPFDRDERRAWYDVLRDLVPTLHGFKPTVRLYAGDYAWCALDAEKATELGTILDLLNSGNSA